MSTPDAPRCLSPHLVGIHPGHLSTAVDADSARAEVPSPRLYGYAPGASPTSVDADAGQSKVPIVQQFRHEPGRFDRRKYIACATRRQVGLHGPGVQRDATTTLEPRNHSRRAWYGLSGGVLLLVLYILATSALSIMRRVRRLFSATDRIANGEIGVAVPRSGIRELDALALGFNDMAAQLTAAQELAHSQQQLLEAKVAARTLQLQQLAQLDP